MWVNHSNWLLKELKKLSLLPEVESHLSHWDLAKLLGTKILTGALGSHFASSSRPWYLVNLFPGQTSLACSL